LSIFSKTLQNFQFWIIQPRLLNCQQIFSTVTLKGPGVRPVVSIAKNIHHNFQHEKEISLTIFTTSVQCSNSARGIQDRDVSDVCNVFDDNDVLSGSDNVMSMMNVK
jgi:hypothetical protein